MSTSNTQKFISQIRELIAKDDIEVAIQKLSDLLKNSPQLDEVVQQSARYNNVMRQIRLGIVDFQSANLVQNQIRNGILEVLNMIEEQGPHFPSIEEEVEGYFVTGEKNILKNSTLQAGRDIHIGDIYVQGQPVPSSIQINKKLFDKSNQHFLFLKNRKYAHVNIDSLLLVEPKSLMKIEITNDETGKKLNLQDCLNWLWEQEKRHAFLLGEGGMGKTVSLLHLWEQMLQSPQLTCPFFLSLNSISKINKANFILLNIKRQYNLNDHEFEYLKSKLREKPQNSIPNVILFLDGHNEIQGNVKEINAELEALSKEYEGLQLVITSRHDLSHSIRNGQFSKLELVQLNIENINHFLENDKIPHPINESLYEVLGNPFNLLMYQASRKPLEKIELDLENESTPYYLKEVNNDVLNTGELMTKVISRVLIKPYRENTSDLTSRFKQWKEHTFLVRHILPAIAYYMENSTDTGYSINEEQIKIPFIEFVQRFENSTYSDFYSKCFPTTKDALKIYLSKDIKWIINELENRLRLLKSIQDPYIARESFAESYIDRYEFFHQNFRDYFSAIHILNELYLNNQSIKNKKKVKPQAPIVVKERVLPINIRKMMGELSQESRYRPIYKNNLWQFPINTPSVLAESLDPVRGLFKKEEVGKTVYNIIQTIIESRQDLSGFDFHRLRLNGLSFKDVRFSNQNADGTYFAADFTYASVKLSQFFNEGHQKNIISVKYSIDGKNFSTWDENLKIEWDTATGKPTSFKRPEKFRWKVKGIRDDKVQYYHISGDKQFGFIVFTEFVDFLHERLPRIQDLGFPRPLRNNTIERGDSWTPMTYLCKYQTGEFLTHFETNKFGWIIISEDSKQVICTKGTDNNELWIWFPHTNESKVLLNYNSAIKPVVFRNDGKSFITISDDMTVKEWDVETGSLRNILPFRAYEYYILKYHPNGKSIFTSNSEGAIFEWDLLRGTLIGTFSNGHESWVYYLDLLLKDEKIERIVTACKNNQIAEWIYDSKTLLPVYQQAIIAFNPRRVRYNNKGSRILVSSSEGIVKEFESGSLLLKKTYFPKKKSTKVYSDSWYSYDEKYIITSFYNQGLCIRSAEVGNNFFHYFSEIKRVDDVIINPKIPLIAVKGRKDEGGFLERGTFRLLLYNYQNDIIQSIFEDEHDFVETAVFSNNGKLFLYADDNDKQIKFFTINDKGVFENTQSFSYSVMRPCSMHFLTDEKIIICFKDGFNDWATSLKIELWDINNGSIEVLMESNEFGAFYDSHIDQDKLKLFFSSVRKIKTEDGMFVQEGETDDFLDIYEFDLIDNSYHKIFHYFKNARYTDQLTLLYGGFRRILFMDYDFFAIEKKSVSLLEYNFNNFLTEGKELIKSNKQTGIPYVFSKQREIEFSKDSSGLKIQGVRFGDFKDWEKEQEGFQKMTILINNGAILSSFVMILYNWMKWLENRSGKLKFIGWILKMLFGIIFTILFWWGIYRFWKLLMQKPIYWLIVVFIVAYLIYYYKKSKYEKSINRFEYGGMDDFNERIPEYVIRKDD